MHANLMNTLCLVLHSYVDINFFLNSSLNSDCFRHSAFKQSHPNARHQLSRKLSFSLAAWSLRSS